MCPFFSDSRPHPHPLSLALARKRGASELKKTKQKHPPSPDFRREKGLGDEAQFSNRPGSLLLEAVLAIGVFSIFLAGIGFSLVLGEKSTVKGGDRVRAVFLAEQQLEAVRGIRNLNFSNVPTGTHGLNKTSTGWVFSGSPSFENGYSARVEIIPRGEDWLEITSIVGWNLDKSRTGSSSLTTYLTDWRKITPVGNWGNLTRLAKIDLAGTPELQKISVSGDFAYLTGSAASGGRGIYVYDISNPGAPGAVAGGFSLDASGFETAEQNGRLYVTTDDVGQEIRVYDSSSPGELSSSKLIASYDLPGTGKARSVAVYGDYVFVGVMDEPPFDQFYALKMSSTGGLAFLDSLSLTGSVLDITMAGDFAYVATSNNAAEMAVVDVTEPFRLKFADGVGLDLPDVHDAAAVASSGTGVLVGRFEGAGIDELTMYSAENSPVPSPPPGPWTLETAGDVRSLQTTYGRYGFVAGNNDTAELRVIDLIKLEQNQPPIVDAYDTTEPINGIFYDFMTDRLYAVTPSSFQVFAPGP